MATTIIVKNNTITDQWLSDFGIKVPVSGQVNLTDTEERDDIYGSYDLKNKVSNDIFIINNGTTDLSKSDALLYLDFGTDYELEAISLSADQVTKQELALIVAFGF